MSSNRLLNQRILARIVVILALVLGGPSARAAGTSYYVSQSEGSDAYDGLAGSYDGAHGPWKTLTKASAVTFQEGDQLLLKCGDTWNDGLVLSGNGTPTNPAVLSAYGTGNRPIIDRQDSVITNMLRCIFLGGNAHGWKIMNLELANAARGIEAYASGAGLSYLWFENLLIHGCKFGSKFKRTSGDQNNMQIGILLAGDGLDKATIVSCVFRDNFVGMTTYMCADIKDCLFEHNEWTGLWYTSSRGATISGNKFMHNCDRNVWCGVSASAMWHTTNGVVEYNEFGETQNVGAAPDGEDLDFEAGCNNVTVRYNLFHDSAGPASMYYSGADNSSPNRDIFIHDNVFLTPAANPPSPYYNCVFLLSDQNTGAITNNRIFPRPGCPLIGGYSCPGVIRTGNLESPIETEERGCNYATNATVSVSSNPGMAQRANDGNSTTVWRGDTTANEWVELDFGASRRLDEFVVEQGLNSSISNFVLQYWNGSAWKDIFTSYGLMGQLKYMPTWPISAAKVRLFIHSTTNGVPVIREFQAYNTLAPRINTQPASVTTNIGCGVAFEVGATNSLPGYPSYQWQRDSADIAGATASALAITNAQTADAGAYWVILTNNWGWVTSAPATLTLLPMPAPRIESAGLSGTDQLRLVIGNTPNAALSLEKSTNLATWETWQTMLSTGAVVEVIADLTNSPSFFRVRQ